MKKLLVYLVLLITFMSCGDGFLTQNHPTATTDEEWWETQQQLRSALDGIYESVPFGNNVDNNRNAFAALTDNGYWNTDFYGAINQFARGEGSPTASAGTFFGFSMLNIWPANYNRIRFASRFIDNAGRAYVEEDLKKRYIAEARALRAWYHLELFLYHKNIPIVKSAVGPEEARQMTNDASADEVVNFIATQLDSAAVDLPYSYPNSEAQRITKGACYSMKAILYLNNKMYEKAAESAKRVIDLTDEGQKVYNLYYSDDPNRNSYHDLFTYSGEINDEGIFVRIDGKSSQWARNAPVGMQGETQGALNPAASLVNTYETKQGKTLDQMSSDSAEIYRANPNYNDNRDPRFKYTILSPGVTFIDNTLEPFNDDPNNPDRIGFSTATGFWARKYLAPEDNGNGWEGSLDYMIIRYAQILLTRVEALVESGSWQHPDVFRYLDQLRDRAGMPPVDRSEYNSVEEVRELYRRERRVELALEGWRWFDIRRWGIGEEVMNGTFYGAIDPATGQPLKVEERNYNPNRDNLWPIPQHEINNSNMTQNPGY